VGTGSGMGGGIRKHAYCCYAYRLYFLTCDMYKSSLRHIHDPVLSSLKMKGILYFFYFNSSVNYKKHDHLKLIYYISYRCHDIHCELSHKIGVCAREKCVSHLNIIAHPLHP
jgi:hypothetical protein